MRHVREHPGFGGRSAPAPRDGVPVTRLKDGERARIVGVEGPGRLAARLHNLGVLPGKDVVKLGTMPGRGPVMLDCEGVRVALGRGIASHVIVERAGPASAEETA